ncbi:rRNA pseudouridine synthase [Candidatus Poribacteria bacterium]|nr:rRNA pseudouridine synthase [Candidatus Poribacteria bacterium]
MRLEKFLSEAGVASRRHAKQIISEGRITVNGQEVFIPGTHIAPVTDVIKLDGKSVSLVKKKVYIALNKPAGYLSTAIDDRDRPTVLHLLRDLPVRVYPVGRLDFDTEGLLLLTNDGELAHKITHPSYQIDKIYIAWVLGHPDESALEKLRNGIQLEDGVTAPAKVIATEQTDNQTCLKMTIHEGKKRQIKRMCRAVGHEVQHLRRIQVGPIKLGNLRVGKYRHLSSKEVEAVNNLF